jgi:hypothetical protein
VGIGHLGVGLAAKRVAPKASLGILLLAAEAIDLLFGVFWAIGVEHLPKPGFVPSNPWSHGLFMSVVWSLAAAALALLFYRDRRTSIVLGLVVFSHWVLDFISHPMMSKVPDLPLFFAGSPRVGLGLYNSTAAIVACEFGLPILGFIIYLRARNQLARPIEARVAD